MAIMVTRAIAGTLGSTARNTGMVAYLAATRPTRGQVKVYVRGHRGAWLPRMASVDELHSLRVVSLPANAAIVRCRWIVTSAETNLRDFGTGYSSLRYLRRLPIQIVKIDQSFIADIDHAPTSTAIMAAVTNLAHVLALTVTAESVETQSHHDAVQATGRDSAQGNFYAPAMAASAIAAQLDARPTSPPHQPTPRHAPTTTKRPAAATQAP